jgi:hypothetical protein
MKNIVCIFILFVGSGLCHTQRTHQFIIREAHQLLRWFLGQRDIPGSQSRPSARYRSGGSATASDRKDY